MENLLNIEETREITFLDKDTFLSLSSSIAFLPQNLTESQRWKKISLSAKEIYRSLVVNYDYEAGISKITHAQILNEAGIGGNATVVKSLDILEESKYIVTVETQSKSHYYLLPYQEKLYASVCRFAERDFSVYYAVKRKLKKDELQDKSPHKLFFKACYNLICFGIEQPEDLLKKYSSNGNTLRIILSMIDAVYIAKKYNLAEHINLSSYIVDMLKSGNITESIFDADIMAKIKQVTIKNKQNLTE